jgi:hypothetical protein
MKKGVTGRMALAQAQAARITVGDRDGMSR